MMTRCHAVPGTLFFQSPEQETNSLEILVDVRHGDAEVEFFEDFYTDVHKNDTFAVFNHAEQYGIIAHDRARKRILLERPYGERTETSVRGRIVKSVGRPADIYSLGALLYYLISGAYANPKSLYDAFRQFLEYKGTENNTIAEYLEYQYGMIRNLRTPRQEGNERDLAPSDRFFSYKHYLDGNGEVIDLEVMQIVARAMIRTKPDSYCHAADLETEGISTMVRDIAALSLRYGLDPRARTALLAGVQRARPHGVLRRLFGRRPRA
jgi:serine/threonine protein kinase